jgi:hypothetical protein
MKHPRINRPPTGRIDLTGQRFGRWTVIEHAGQLWPQTTWRCRCDCGHIEASIPYSRLVRGRPTSCTCPRPAERQQEPHPPKARRVRKQSRVRAAWAQMKQRCYNQNRPEWKNYGGRGISVCRRWLDSFENFLADMGEPPVGHSLDRRENDGDYEPGNCRWATTLVQAGNRRNVERIPWRGEQRTLTEIALLENVEFHSFHNKVRIYGRTIEQAVADCRKRGLTYKERAKAQRPTPELTLP